MAILVYGDVMLDEWRIGSVDRISPEAPVPVLLENDYRCNVGGAGNLAVNLASINGPVDLYGPLGKDKQGNKFLPYVRYITYPQFHEIISIPSNGPQTHQLNKLPP